MSKTDKRVSSLFRPRRSIMAMSHSKYELNDSTTKVKWKKVTNKAEKAFRKIMDEIHSNVPLGESESYKDMARQFNLPVAPLQVKPSNNDSAATIEINLEDPPDDFFDYNLKRNIDKRRRRRISFIESSSDIINESSFEKSDLFEDNINVQIIKEPHKDTNTTSENSVGSFSKIQTNKNRVCREIDSDEFICREIFNEEREKYETKPDLTENIKEDVIESIKFTSSQVISKSILEVDDKAPIRIFDDKFLAQFEEFTSSIMWGVGGSKSGLSGLKDRLQEETKFSENIETYLENTIQEIIAEVFDLKPYKPTQESVVNLSKEPNFETRSEDEISRETFDDMFVEIDESDFTLREKLLEPKLFSRRYSTKHKIYLKFLRMSEQNAAVWRPKEDRSEQLDMMQLTKRAAYVENTVATEFCNWIDSLGGTTSGLTPEILKEMFEIGCVNPTSQSICNKVEEKIVLPNLLAVFEDIRKKSMRYQLRRQLAWDAWAQKLPVRKVAFNTMLPPESRIYSSKNDVEDEWLRCKTIPPDIFDFTTTFAEILHLRTLEGYCQFLNKSPFHKKPAYLKQQNMFSFYSQSKLKLKKHVSKSKLTEQKAKNVSSKK